MKHQKIAIIDYGAGNLQSVFLALKKLEADVFFANTPEDLALADKAILPGVGAFSDGMNEIVKLGFDDGIKKFIKEGKFFLGICLGMQMLVNTSYEFIERQGLALIPGMVEEIPIGIDINSANEVENLLRKVPHVGWNELIVHDVHGAANKLLLLPAVKKYVYFVHSFRVILENKSNELASCLYDGVDICAAINQDNVYGLQFHPEKSGEIGLSILQNFMLL